MGLHGALHLLDVEAQAKGNFACLEGLQAHRRLDGDLDHRVGLFRGNLLDLHAAFPGGDDAYALLFPVEHVAEIEFAFDLVGRFDVDALDRLAVGVGLMGDETLAEHLFGCVAYLAVGPAQLDAAGLAARASMDLGLDRPMPAADFGGSVDGLVRAEGNGATRHVHPGALQQFFGLVFMEVHWRLLCGSLCPLALATYVENQCAGGSSCATWPR